MRAFLDYGKAVAATNWRGTSESSIGYVKFKIFIRHISRGII